MTQSVNTTTPLDSFGENTMYDMYPEWGPAQHRETQDNGTPLQSVQSGLDLRDNGGQRPDDN